MHEGRTVQWRSQESILAEARRLTAYPDFTGYIRDVGGPTANMYGFECKDKLQRGTCPDKRCLSPRVCPSLKADHQHQLELLRKLRRIEGVKKVFVASGIRYDMLLSDKLHGEAYLKEVIGHHVSGQMKIAPEHTEEGVLRKMGKPGTASLLEFKALFDKLTKRADKEQFLTYYLIAAHPGCTAADMRRLKAIHQPKPQDEPGTGPDIPTRALHLVRRDVLHRVGPVHREAGVCGERPEE